MITESQPIKQNDITWGVSGRGEATVLCHHCNRIFGKAENTGKAMEIVYLAEETHTCKATNHVMRGK